MPERYDDAKVREAVSDMQTVAEISAEIRGLKQKLDDSRGPEEGKKIRGEISEKSAEKQEIIDTFDKKYEVSTPRDLDIALREQGVNYRQSKAPQQQHEGEEAHSKKSTQGHNEQSVVMVKKVDMEAVAQCVKNMKAAQESNNYIALQEEANKLLEISQRISREIGENVQQLEAVKDTKHGSKDLNHAELISKLLREHGDADQGRDRTK